MSADDGKERLLQLLDYVQHMMRLPERARFSVKDSGSFVYLEETLHDRIGVEFDSRDDRGPAWLKLVRLQRMDPPEPPAELRPWITKHRNPVREPKVLAERTETMTEKESKRLVDLGLVDPAEVRKLRKRSAKKEKMVQVKLRLQKDGGLSEAIGQYLAGPWQRWAEMEKPRRATMKIYNDFFKLHQSIQAGAVEAPVEIIWGIGVAVWKSPSGAIKHPLIEVLVEIDIDPRTQDILIRRRAASEPQVFLKQFHSVESPGLVALHDKAKKYFEDLRDGEDPREISPFARDTFEPLLRLATTLLTSSAHYYPDVAPHPSRELPVPTESLQITDTWVIYARPRSENLFIEDVELLKKAVEAADFDTMPTAARGFVADPSDKPTYRPQRVDLLGGASNVDGDLEVGDQQEESCELFFPREYNDAQVKIIHELEQYDGIVVQGPPGTGKTHTIANIICHYLATGRRVLVTSQGEPALNVLRGFIPEEIRRLTISLLTKDSEGLQQLETAVTLLANEVGRIVPEHIEKQIIDGEKRLRELREQIRANEQSVREIAERQLTKHKHKMLGRGDWTPAELAARLLKDRGQHDWLTDSPDLDERFNPQFSAKDVSAARQARRRLGTDLQYLKSVLPKTGDLPDRSTIRDAHLQIVEADQNDPHAARSDFPKLSEIADDAVGRASTLIDRLRELVAVQDVVAPHPWLARLFHTWLELGVETAVTAPFEALVSDLHALAGRAPAFDECPVSVPDLGADAEGVLAAVARAAEDRRPFGTLAIGMAQAKQLFAEIRVNGKTPDSPEAWQHVQGYLDFVAESSVIAERWNEIADRFDLPQVDEAGASTARSVLEHYHLIHHARQAATLSLRDLRREVLELFPQGINADDVCSDRATALQTIDDIDANLRSSDRSAAQETIDDLIRLLSTYDGPIIKRATAFLRGKVGNQAIPTEEISSDWDSLLADVQRVHSLSRDFEMVTKLAELVEASGAPLWAEALRTDPADGKNDRWTPDHALDSWAWRRLATFLRGIDGREPIRDLSRSCRTLEAERRTTLTELVRLRTFLGLYVNMTDRAKSALVRFTAAIRHIGGGEGNRSRRHKRDAQLAMNDCYTAVPCWIMPIWRVSETLPAEIGSFDLVIVDEASQSDILALPALMRGKKILIVGDDKQVSPIAPFVEERKLLQLRSQHLNNQIFVDLMLPGSSLYDLANAVFSGRRIMLDEHFRCVEPIIRFSFRFYPEKIIPVRIPKPSERLDPPLVDIYLPNGKRDHKKINRAEAHAIVDEIEKLVDDPVYKGRSIGVVSLIGAQQGEYIQNLLLRRIGQEKYLDHRIDCGDSATFQGRERDIMFVSMVTSPGHIAAQTAVIYEQRFNVALSRARDRTYLYRSVQPSDLNPKDLKSKVIEHFTRAKEDPEASTENLIDRCTTDLEREMFGCLRELGYRVTPHVSVGNYSIDLVVEGKDDRRLAIELDGDREQTAAGWLAIWSQQKVLERVGWRFWRCWASSFILDADACMKDLLDTLAEMEITPIGQVAVDEAHSETRVLDEEERTEEEHEDEELAIAMLVEGDEGDLTVEVGDRVLVSYSDDPSRYRTLVFSETEHDPDNGIFGPQDPVSRAMLGASVGQEIETPFHGDAHRVVTIFQIEKSGATTGGSLMGI